MRRSRQILLAAFLLSLLLHAIVGLSVNGFGSSPPARPEIVTHARVISLRRATPRPARTPPPAVHRKKPVPRRAARNGRKPSVVAAVVTPPPPSAPTPVASAQPSPRRCSGNSIAAALQATPPPPDIPLPIRADAISGTTRVRVQLDARGAVIGTKVVASTGNPSLDLVAVAMAREAQYAPAVSNCKPVVGSYFFNAKFVAW